MGAWKAYRGHQTAVASSDMPRASATSTRCWSDDAVRGSRIILVYTTIGADDRATQSEDEPCPCLFCTAQDSDGLPKGKAGRKFSAARASFFRRNVGMWTDGGKQRIEKHCRLWRGSSDGSPGIRTTMLVRSQLTAQLGGSNAAMRREQMTWRAKKEAGRLALPHHPVGLGWPGAGGMEISYCCTTLTRRGDANLGVSNVARSPTLQTRGCLSA